MAPDNRFSKWQGLGNDYIIVSPADLDFELTPERAAAICDRHTGVGSDGILAWEPSQKADFRLDIINPDGSRAEMCGNGIRMLARFLYTRGHAKSPAFMVDTDAGIIAPVVNADGTVRVEMGTARLGGDGIVGFAGVRNESEVINRVLDAAGESYTFTFVSMGNPHCVIETRDLDSLDLAGIGPAIEHHELFPGRANVEFIKVLGPAEIAMRVWERGVGETMACGTGACAAAVAAFRTRGIRSPMTVHLPGGDLIIEVSAEMDVVMTGPAREIYEGILAAEFVKHIKEL